MSSTGSRRTAQPHRLDAPAEGDVFHRIAAHSGVSACGEVSLAAEHHPLPVAEGQPRRTQAVGQRDRQEGEEAAHGDGDGEPLAPGVGVLAEKARHHVGVLRLERRHAPAQGLGMVDGVGIDEEEDGARGGVGQLRAGPRLAKPVLRQWLTGQQVQARVPSCQSSHHAARAVARSIVEDQDLVVRIVLSQERLDAGDDARALVAHRDEDRQAGKRARGGIGRQPAQRARVDNGDQENDSEEDRDADLMLVPEGRHRSLPRQRRTHGRRRGGACTSSRCFQRRMARLPAQTARRGQGEWRRTR